MVTFIGDNDASTLHGVIEELNRELRQHEIASTRATLKRDQYAASRIAGILKMLVARFEDAAKNGPTPDLTKLATAKLRLTNESETALRALREQGYRPQAGTRSADDIANEMLAKVDLDNEELLTPSTRCKNCDEIIGEEDGYRHHPSGKGYVHKYCPEEVDDLLGINDVDASISCTFCGADLAEDGDCTASIDDLCTVGPIAVEETEQAMQDLGELAGIKATVSEGTNGWFILFDGAQIGIQKSRFQAQIKAIERLSVRLQGRLAGSPDITYGVCVPCSSGDTIFRAIVRYNGQTWECEKHRPDWNVLGCKDCGLYPDIDCPVHKPAEVGA